MRWLAREFTSAQQVVAVARGAAQFVNRGRNMPGRVIDGLVRSAVGCYGGGYPTGRVINPRVRQALVRFFPLAKARRHLHALQGMIPETLSDA